MTLDKRIEKMIKEKEKVVQGGLAHITLDRRIEKMIKEREKENYPIITMTEEDLKYHIEHYTAELEDDEKEMLVKFIDNMTGEQYKDILLQVDTDYAQVLGDILSDYTSELITKLKAQADIQYELMKEYKENE